MKREEILKNLGFEVAKNKKKRVIVHSDIKCEADDQYAIVHHLLSPSFDVKGIIASHFEWRYDYSERLRKYRGTSMMQSFEEGKKILELMEIDDVPLLEGSKDFLTVGQELPDSPGADFIIEEAMKEDDVPLFIALQGALTDLAIAYKKKPEIAERLTAVWIGGGAYPDGGDEPNTKEDPLAAHIVFESPIPIWQIPASVYPTMEFSLSEVVDKVKPCGKIGEYLCKQMLELNDLYGNMPVKMDFPHGETWSIGDNPTVGVLLQSAAIKCWHTEKAPNINMDMSYTANPDGKEIRVYDWLDTRMALGDFFSKLRLCYGTKITD